MAGQFTASGKVVTALNATSNFFNSNANSNAVRQVFGEASSNLLGLVGSNYNTSARPPPFSASAVPAAPLSMSFFAGKSLLLSSPAISIGNIGASTVTPTVTGGGGTSYKIAVGTSAGASDSTGGWKDATSGTAITTQVDNTTALAFSAGSSYYISAYSSNADSNTSSLSVSNATAFGYPNVPINLTLTLNSLTSWTISWAAGTGIAPTYYYGGLYYPGPPAAWIDLQASLVSPYNGTTRISQDTSYSAIIYSGRPESSLYGTQSATTSLPSPAPPVFSTNSISNTTFTAVAASTTGNTTVSYAISPSSGVTQSSTGVFTSLSSNTQYTVTATAVNNTTQTSSSANSAAVWCLAAPTAISVAPLSISNSTSAVSFTGNTTASASGTYTINMGGAAKTSAASGNTFTPSASNSSSTYQSNTLVTVSVSAVATNSTYTSSLIYFVCQPTGGLTYGFVPPAGTTTLKISLTSGSGGYGVDESGNSAPYPGFASYVTGTAPTSTFTIGLRSGQRGPNGSNSLSANAFTASAKSGDGVVGGNGGRGKRSSGQYYGSQGGCSGGGGAASFIYNASGGSDFIFVGGGGGSGAGTSQAGEGGAGGGSGLIGIQGNSYSNSLGDSGNGGGNMGGYGGGSRSGNVFAGGNGGDHGNCGTPGFGLSGNSYNVTSVTSNSGNGGDGVADNGQAGGGGGGGAGGGGSGSARNYNNSHDSAGGGGGGSGSSWTGATLTFGAGGQYDGLNFVMVS